MSYSKIPPGKYGRAGEQREHLGGGAAVRRMARDITGERRRDKADQLIRHPILGENPIDAADLRRIVERRDAVDRALPRANGDLALAAGQVFMPFAGRRGRGRDHFDQASFQRQAIRMVRRAARDPTTGRAAPCSG